MSGRSGASKASRSLLLALAIAGGAVSVGPAPAQFDLPKSLPPEQYGNLLLDRLTAKAGEKAVGFSHWSHRLRYTCRVCHNELEFAWVKGESGVSEAESRKGRFCGVCHDGKVAFGHTEANCSRCHSGSLKSGKESVARLRELPKARFGNEVDWSAALEKGLIKPVNSLAADYRAMPFDKVLTLEAEWAMISPAIFPHDKHLAWLDCASCHPEPFNIQKKTTKHFAMTHILRRQFCGACHLDVAFPLEDCKRCHPGLRRFP